MIAYETIGPRGAGRAASRSRTISRIWRCMDFCICWATITRPMRRRTPWRRWRSRVLARLDVPDPYPASAQARRGLIADPHARARSIRLARIARPGNEARNLPVPVPPAAWCGTSAAKAGSRGSLRVVFGWKAGSIRADISEVLKAGAGETGFSPEERTCCRTSSACASGGSRTSWCRAPTSSRCSRRSRSAN